MIINKTIYHGLLAGFFIMITVSAQAMISCTVSSSPVMFAGYSPFNLNDVSSTGQITVTCQPMPANQSTQGNIQITLSAGTGGSFNPRKMMGPLSEVIEYNLFTNPSHTIIWGNGAGGTNAVNDTFIVYAYSVAIKKYTIYGLIPSGQNVGVGSYSDNVQVTVNYY